MNPSTHLSLTTRLLHWSVALLMIGLTLVGSYGDFWCMGGVEEVAYPAD